MTFSQIFGTCIHAFGTPKQDFSDNGSKFVDDEFQEVGGDKYNNRDNTTIMDSVSVTNMFLKICEYAKCDVEVALAWVLVPKIL